MKTSNLVKNIVSDLQNKYSVDQHFYPKMSINTDIEGGMGGEVNTVVGLLKSNGFDISSENVFHAMELKKRLMERYLGKEGGETLKDYRKLILEDIKPVGIVGSVEFCLVNGLIIVGLYLLGRFAGSFADESGKILAQKLLDKPKDNSRKLNIDIREYKILSKEVNLFIEEKKILDLAKSNLKKKGKKKKKQRPAIKKEDLPISTD